MRGRGRNTQSQHVLAGPCRREESTDLNYSFDGANAGPSTPVDSSMSEMVIFCRFYTNEVWDLLTTDTNRYAAGFRGQCLHTSHRPWNDVTVTEMKAFIGILILMGICRLPRLSLLEDTPIYMSRNL